MHARRVASFIARDPARVLVLAHGYPWPDESRSDDELFEYAPATVERWSAFAEEQHAIILAPAFGGEVFPVYREMRGRSISPDKFVNLLVERVARQHIPRFEGRFSLHGHSAGAQFAGRYLVTHPDRLDEVVLSAPSTFPMPDPAIPWPDGMAPARWCGLAPRSARWLTAATEVSVTVLVGTRDTERRPAAPGQQGWTRLDRAAGWVESMRRHAEASDKTSRIPACPGRWN